MNVDCNWSRPVLQILQQGVTWQRTKNLHATKTDGFWYFFFNAIRVYTMDYNGLEYSLFTFLYNNELYEIAFQCRKKAEAISLQFTQERKKNGMKKSTWSIPFQWHQKRKPTHTRNTKQLKEVFFFVSGQRNRLAVRLQCAVFKIFARKKRVDSMRASNKKKRLAKRNESREKKIRQRTTKYKYGVYYIVYAL